MSTGDKSIRGSTASNRTESNAITKESIGIVIIDDHRMVADALAELIGAESDLEVLGIAGTVAEGVAVTERTRPDLVLLDYSLPDGNGGMAARAIKARWPGIALVMLTGAGGQQALSDAVSAGCTGFLIKELHGPVLVDAIRSVYHGEVVIHAKALAELLAHEAVAPHYLTTREMEVLELLARGTSTEEIARTLYLSSHTVRNHVSNILSKMGAHSKLEAVTVAIRERIVDISTEMPRVVNGVAIGSR